MLKSHALIIACANHADRPETQHWKEQGVSKKWLDGFHKRWGHLLSSRYGEGVCGQRRQVTKQQVEVLYDIVREVGEEIGEDWVDGKRRLSKRQVCLPWVSFRSCTCMHHQQPDVVMTVLMLCKAL
jgi:hypothetical protein